MKLKSWAVNRRLASCNSRDLRRSHPVSLRAANVRYAPGIGDDATSRGTRRKSTGQTPLHPRRGDERQRFDMRDVGKCLSRGGIARGVVPVPM